ncbi:hypothetical protein MPTK1_5g09390 [Marchantia polymorpha subsp. ruderalis]|uniref:Uncharacterized protein n=2 Tax=Marchantia polymorpha TaxID=3197 RepID=A0AAF6BGK5_MARPO|nr:hypothetical protein MARPO_0095s0021 [Marchantia polymorpha]BBN11139.1 hypothetical protein Mp_5g09390 [Marchantia polymorpha subsp. ruderalis]|eukprot:PTQ32759.1 hypothetical protein MARPO_0095s0021 [Marchantia polymorpha]
MVSTRTSSRYWLLMGVAKSELESFGNLYFTHARAMIDVVDRIRDLGRKGTDKEFRPRAPERPASRPCSSMYSPEYYDSTPAARAAGWI